jgi:Zn-dependent protease
MYFPKGTLEMGKPGKFSKTEIIHLAVALLILTLAFSFPLSQSRLLFGGINLEAWVFALPTSFLALLTAFFVHELSHKFMAQKYGLWSEFRMFPAGLVISFFLAMFTGVVFAAPGAVMFRGETRPFEMGRIAAAGSFANIIIALVTLPLYLFVFFESGFIGKMVGFICAVNALLATFNLLPFGTLDGKKVIQWNGIIWAVLFIFALLLTINILPRLPYFLSY